MRAPLNVGYDTRWLSSAETDPGATIQSERTPPAVSLPLARKAHGEASDDSARLRAIETAVERRAASAIRRTVTAADPASASAPVARMTMATTTSTSVNPTRVLSMRGRYALHRLTRHRQTDRVIESLRKEVLESARSAESFSKRKAASWPPFPCASEGETARGKSSPRAAHSLSRLLIRCR